MDKSSDIPPDIRRELRLLAKRYETAAFLEGDPSSLMHKVDGAETVEATAFLAAMLSFGNRKQFMEKAERIVFSFASGDTASWIKNGGFVREFPSGSKDCFYRFYTLGDMREFFEAYRAIICSCGSLGALVKGMKAHTGEEAMKVVCDAFPVKVVPKYGASANKRVAMFLRWMVRDSSPVDLGLWRDFIDKRTLLMPLDTHVIQQAKRLGLLSGGATASLSTARRLTAKLAEVFPEDPLLADFALFGYGVNHKGGSQTR